MTKFKVGDILFRDSLETSSVKIGDLVKIISIDRGGYVVATIKSKALPKEWHIDDLNPNYWSIYHKTIRDAEVGDVLIKPGYEGNVRIVNTEGIGFSYKNATSLYWYDFNLLEKNGWTIKDQSETITIDGKTYNKDDVEKRLKELSPIHE